MVAHEHDSNPEMMDDGSSTLASSDSDDNGDIDAEEDEEVAPHSPENLPAKFNMEDVEHHLANGPASSSDEDGDDENDVSEDDVDSSDDEEDKNQTVSGWADAMEKVLNTGKRAEPGKPLLLSKAKKDGDVKKTGETSDNLESKKPLESAAKRRAKKKEIDGKGRKWPDIGRDRANEKKLVKIATRGVVQLFNAVREQQKTLKSELAQAGLSTSKRDKVFKNMDKDAFLEVLSGKKRKAGSDSRHAVTSKKVKDEAADDDGTWSVLKDDFMMGAKMKDWDRQEDSE